MRWIATLAATVVPMLVYLWQEGGVALSNDGVRYTSKKPQPSPFHRRYCDWNPSALTLLTWVSLVAIGITLGSWQKALLFMTLPGVWFLTTRPTAVDAVALALAWTGAQGFVRESAAGNPWFGVGSVVVASFASGRVHERGPIFAALYAWHPLPLVGLLGVGWWRKPAPADGDPRVGLSGVWAALKVHRPDNDWLALFPTVFATRGVPVLAAFYGAPPKAWVAFAVAWVSRVLGTDLGRFALWGALPLVAALPDDVPVWMVVVHVMTFWRMW